MMPEKTTGMAGVSSLRGRFINSGVGPSLVPVDIGHATHLAMVDPRSAFWTLVRKSKMGNLLTESGLMASYMEKSADFTSEIENLRFGLRPSAVYFNPTDRCNLDCTYCYIPSEMRRSGEHMSQEKLHEALTVLKEYFSKTIPSDRRPRIIFHGAEPLMNFKVVRSGIETFTDDFIFGIQTNATLLDDDTLRFLIAHNVSIGLSLDGPTEQITNLTRKSFSGKLPVHDAVLSAIDRLRGYEGFSVIVTVTQENVDSLSSMVEFLHEREVPSCLLNMTRCTLPESRKVRVDDTLAAAPFIAALERTHTLYKETGRKLVVANFANILLAILAPTARRLMCDISPCGGGRAFFALSANGDLYPCSEFIGLKNFCGGNIFSSGIEQAMTSDAFNKVTQRDVDRFEPCGSCAIRHFCGSPCPAEAHEMNGGMDRIGAFCEFYEEQVRYAFRLIADNKANDFLWNGWDDGVETVFDVAESLTTV